MKGLLSILVALILLMPNGSLFAQVENEIEYYFGKEVTETIEQFLSEQEFDQGEQTKGEGEKEGAESGSYGKEAAAKESREEEDEEE